MRYEAVNHLISKCSKLAQKEYKTRHNLVGNLIYRESCKIHKPESHNKYMQLTDTKGIQD